MGRKRRYRDDGQYAGPATDRKQSRYDYKTTKLSEKVERQKWTAIKRKWTAIILLAALAGFLLFKFGGFKL